MTSRIARTIFLTSVFAYAGFAYLDYLEPGVVSDVMSVHLWLLPIIASGIFWAKVVGAGHAPPVHRAIAITAAIIIGLALATILWHNGDMFGDFRLLLALAAAALPILASRVPS